MKHIKDMTDEDFIKALECCSNPLSDCPDCPLKVWDGCTQIAMKKVLDINARREAEIERYKQNEKFIDKKCDDILMKLNKLNQEISETVVSSKAEAVKEFWSKVVEKYESIDGQYVDRVMNYIVKDIIKAMEGEAQ